MSRQATTETQICETCGKELPKTRAYFTPMDNVQYVPRHFRKSCRACRSQKSELQKAHRAEDKAAALKSEIEKFGKPLPAAIAAPPPAELPRLAANILILPGDRVFTALGWKPVHPGDALVGLRVGEHHVVRPPRPQEKPDFVPERLPAKPKNPVGNKKWRMTISQEKGSSV
jgi:hypothetical protein